MRRGTWWEGGPPRRLWGGGVTWGQGSDWLRSSPPRRCLRPPLPPFSGSGSGSPSPTRPSMLRVTDRAERPMRGILGGLAGGALGGRGRGGSARARDAGTCSSRRWEEPVAAGVLLGVGWSPLRARRSPAGNFFKARPANRLTSRSGRLKEKRVAERWKKAEGCCRIGRGKAWCEWGRLVRS